MEGHLKSDTGSCNKRRFDDPIEADAFRISLSRGHHPNGSRRPDGDPVIIWCEVCGTFHVSAGEAERNLSKDPRRGMFGMRASIRVEGRRDGECLQEVCHQTFSPKSR